MKFEILSDNGYTVHLRGSISESIETSTSDLTKAFTGGPPSIYIDLGNIESINSIGVAAWLNLLSELPSTLGYTFLNCPPVFINYLNLIPKLVGKGKLASVQVPYECLNCGNGWVVSKNVSDLRACDEFDSLPCPTCSTNSNSSELADDYLDFLAD